MKQSFMRILENELWKNRKTFKVLCSCPLLNLSSTYTVILGIIGVLLSLFDIYRIIQAGSILPYPLVRQRLQTGKLVSPECERDLKLISLVLSLEYYCLLIFGVLNKHPTLFLPWMILYVFIILAEFSIFIVRTFMDGLILEKHILLMSMFIIFNWLSIFCTFMRIYRN